MSHDKRCVRTIIDFWNDFRDIDVGRIIALPELII